MAMTSHCLDFAIISGPEINTPHVMSALYENLHLALVRDRIDHIGVSFPRYSATPKTIGNVLRIHGIESMLHAFMETDWLKGVRDHVCMTAIAAAPHDALHCTSSSASNSKPVWNACAAAACVEKMKLKRKLNRRFPIPLDVFRICLMFAFSAAALARNFACT